MYDPTTARWLTQDPLAEKMYSLTPYRYGLNNPIMIIDFMGLSDYFDFHGRFLGSDNSTEDYIRIITENDWKSICFSDHSGNLIVDAELGLRLSKPFSKANLDSESSLYIYDYYNITGLTLKDRGLEPKRKDDEGAGMTFRVSIINRENPSYEHYIAIPIELNKQIDIYDNYNNIINSFVHEYKHYLDYAKYGLQGYLSIKDKDRDKHTTISFQKKIVSLLNNN